MFLICPYSGPLLHFYAPFWIFFCPMGLFLGSRSGSKTVLEPTNVDYQFLFWKYSPIFLFLIRPNFGPFCTFWALRGYFFWSYGAIFGVQVRFKNVFGTYWCRLSIFVLEVQPYLYVFNSGKFLTFLGPLVFFGQLGLFLGSRSGSKTFLEPTTVNYQFLFWKYSPIFLFSIWQNLGPFCTFWALRGYHFGLLGLFWGQGQVQKYFRNLLM